MYEISYGKKYEKGLDVKEIAKRFREEVAEGVKTGTLPKGLKVSVKISRYSGGRSIDVEVVACPFAVANPERLAVELAQGKNTFLPECHYPILTPAAKELQTKLDGMLQAYNFDGSEIQSDYFHVNFYGNAKISWKLLDLERAAFRAAKVEAPAFLDWTQV